MEENIVGLIAEAEARAAERKERAELHAAQCVAAAEKRAAEIAKESQESLRLLREARLQEAEQQASSAYATALDTSRVEAARYADSVLSRSEEMVAEIVGRLTK